MIDHLPLPIELPHDAIAHFCRGWKITKMEVFGSVLRDDFGPESDVDFLVTFKLTRVSACLILCMRKGNSLTWSDVT